jgi:2-haloacid dehalogenase
MLKLEPLPKVITFDCYGTLVQWHRAVRDAARAVLSRHHRNDNTGEQAHVLADRLREVAVAQQQRPPFRDYKSVLHSSLDEALAEFGHGHPGRPRDTSVNPAGDRATPRSSCRA